MTATLYAHPRCSTCRDARRWLDAHAIPVEVFDLTQAAPAPPLLREIFHRSGLPLKKLFNTSGQVYRAGDYGRRLPAMSEDEMLAALAGDGLLIKRPIFSGDARVLVGFDPDAWSSALL